MSWGEGFSEKQLSNSSSGNTFQESKGVYSFLHRFCCLVYALSRGVKRAQAKTESNNSSVGMKQAARIWDKRGVASASAPRQAQGFRP